MAIYKAGVLGAGLMGSGIAQAITFAGLPVVLRDVNDALVQKGLANIRKIYEGRVKKGKMSQEEVEAKMGLVTGSTSDADFADCDIVIEAIPEEMELKRKGFAAMDAACPEHAILVSNTSSLSISAIAASTKRPDKVAGLHFFYPAPVMKLVEVIPGLQTSQETVDALVSFTESIRKLPVRVKECPGFLVNRLLMPYLNEAAFCLQEGAASAKEIDAAAVAWGWPMGPFTLADELGLDICAHVGNILLEGYGPRMRPAPIIGSLFEKKMFGRKSGAGFYTYDDRPDPAAGVLAGFQRETKIIGAAFSMERLMYAMVNEAAFALEENVASPSDIDLAMVAGTGFPMAKEGLLRWADSVGLDRILGSLDVWKRTAGERFWPAALLRRMVGAGMTGKSARKGFFEYA
ncbi:MAG: 3-hydroxyacyl-CoA dehydrogenase [Planctomycetota bacterium]